MSKLRYVGVDVHKDSMVLAVADDDSSSAVDVCRIPWSESSLLKALRKLGPLSDLRVCYEAGPTGYGLQRFLSAAKVDCVVVAPSLIPRQPGQRIKTDRRDARKLAHFLRSGDLTAIWIPDEQTEALRDLVRARDDARLAERRVKQQLQKFLLRQGRRYDSDKRGWTRAYLTWVRQQQFAHEAQQRVLSDTLTALTMASARIARLDEDITECLPSWTLAPLVKNLQAFYGIKQLTAVGLAAEVGDFSRFPRAGKIMSFVGLVPCESSSGQSRWQGGITKTGNRHVRRLLIEAAWHYVGCRPTPSQRVIDRREGIPANIIEIADRAIRRLRRKAQWLAKRKKSSTKIATALARELMGFIWAAARATAGLPIPNRSVPADISTTPIGSVSPPTTTLCKKPRRPTAAGATR